MPTRSTFECGQCASSRIPSEVTASLHFNRSPAAAPLEVGAGAQETLASPKTTTGSDFDRAYIDAQVKAHQEVLDALDNKLIPNAQDASLKANLQQVRPTVAQHLKKGAALPERA
jgi:putative membrane protein